MRALVRTRSFLRLAAGLRETRRSCAARTRCTHSIATCTVQAPPPLARVTSPARGALRPVRAALEVVTRQGSPRRWAEGQEAFGFALLNLAFITDGASPGAGGPGWDEAIVALRAALEEQARGPTWVGALRKSQFGVGTPRLSKTQPGWCARQRARLRSERTVCRGCGAVSAGRRSIVVARRGCTVSMAMGALGSHSLLLR